MSKIVHQVNKRVARELIRTVDNFLFDCDGVLWHSNAVIPGCPETLQRLKHMGKRLFYVTNHSSKTRAQMVAKCKQMGFPAEEENIVCTAHAAALYLRRMNFTGKIYLVGNASMAAECQANGIEYEGLGPDVLPPEQQVFDEIIRYHKEWVPDPKINGVLVGFDPHVSYMKLIKAATYAHDRNNLFLATNEDSRSPIVGKGAIIPSSGSIVQAVKVPARREPHVIGKPGTAMFDLLHEVHGLEAERTLMVGDNLNTDVAFAVNCSLRSLMVLTGVDDLQHVEEHQQSDCIHKRHVVPDYYIDSLAHFGELLRQADL